MHNHHRSLLGHNTIAEHRDALALTQRQLGSILSLSDDGIGNFERGERAPLCDRALALELVFGASLIDLYPGLARALAQEMLPALQKLSVAVEWSDDPKAGEIRTALSPIGARLSSLIPTA